MISAHRAIPRHRGFSLVEIMVGVLIGMLSIAAIFQALEWSQQRERTIGAGSDALASGAILYNLVQRASANAGYGVMSPGVVGCTITVASGAVIPAAPAIINSSLVPAGDANTDTLLVLISDTNAAPFPYEDIQKDTRSAGTTFDFGVPVSSAFKVNDVVFAVPGTNMGDCNTNLSLSRVTVITSTGVTLAGSVAGGYLVNLGSAPTFVAYAVRNGAMTSCNFVTADCRQIANYERVSDGVAGFRVQYVKGNGTAFDQTTPTTPAQWATLTGLRFGLLTRSAQYESRLNATTGQRECEPVTPTAPQWSGSSGAAFVPPGADWQCYRYHVFESVVPTRNVIELPLE